MNAEQAGALKEAIEGIRRTLRNTPLTECDLDDLDELMDQAEAELDNARPNMRTLSVSLNSVARSLRTDPGARHACLELDGAMRAAGVVSDWAR